MRFSEGIAPFKIDAPTLGESQEELIANCKEMISGVFLLECLIQQNKGETVISDIYSVNDYNLSLRRVVDYIEQHCKDICTVSSGMLKLLSNRNFHNISADGNQVAKYERT